MGFLVHASSGRRWYLETETVIGRGSQSALRLEARHVSTQHAMLRWNGASWQLRDLASRNGTRLNGERLETARLYGVNRGDVMEFGHVDDTWQLASDDAPETFLLNMASSEQLLVRDALVGIPSDDVPDATLYRTKAGAWVLEVDDRRPLALSNGTQLDVAGQAWKFCCPDAISSTATADRACDSQALVLHFCVSKDEEYVELHIELPDRTIPMGSRGHNHLLLTLARARLRDMQAGEVQTSCGWVYKEDLVSTLETPQRVDNEVFRVRKHFARLVPDASASIIERRSRTRQLRLGFDQIRVTSL